jgi:hypothetical protein
MSTPADHHPALNGQSFDDWWATQIPGRAPRAPVILPYEPVKITKKRAKATQIPDRAPGKPRHARASHARPGWLRSALGRAALYWQARKGLRARWDARNRAYDAETERLFGVMHAEQEAADLAALAEAMRGAELTAGPEDPCDVLTPEDEADEWVGPVSAPAGTPEPELPADTFNHVPVIEDGDEPLLWATGEFPAAIAAMGGGQ